MTLFIGLVTPDERLRAYFGKGKVGVIPPEALKRGAWQGREPNVTTLAWAPADDISSTALERFLLSKARDCTACVLLVDSDWAHLVKDVRTAVFVSTFEAAASAENPQNFFFGLLSRTLKGFGQVLAKFKNGDDAQLLTLPLRNFNAVELAEIATICGAGPAPVALSNEVDQRLALLRKRVRPRKKSKYKTLYAVDDDDKFFVYGKEKHSQFDTGTPHRPSCEMAALFRFGARLAERRHYNVSKTEGDLTSIAGSFPDCHGQLHPVKQRTHLNMFANDYF